MTPQNPESFANSFRDIWHFTVRAYGRDNYVSYTLKTESLYSDEYSFTTGATVTKIMCQTMKQVSFILSRQNINPSKLSAIEYHNTVTTSIKKTTRLPFQSRRGRD